MSLVIKRYSNLIFVNKPPGLLVHRSPIDKNETEFLIQNLRDEIGEKVYPIHRLDKPTSGIILFTLDKEIIPSYQKLWENNQIDKMYSCVVRGWLTQKVELNYPLEQFDKLKERKSEAQGIKKEAISIFSPVEKYETEVSFGKFPTARYSLLDVNILTGRRHQIRRHAAHLRHPIIGDANHGDGKHNRFFREELNCPGLLLQSRYLGFEDPISGEYISAELELDNRITCLLSKLDKKT